MEITHKGNEFIATIDDQQAGLIEYSLVNEHTIILAHTEVNDNFRGQGVGQAILKHIIEYARENDIRLIPLCPFTKAEIDKHPEYHDVLHQKTEKS